MLIHWFAENLDEYFCEKVSAMPLGMVYADGRLPSKLEAPTIPPLAHRPNKAFCSHRIREGEQWEPRRKVTDYAQGDWSSICTVVIDELPEIEFLGNVAKHRFVLCVEGGGLDPSPKAWQSILYGAIPIIRQSPVADIYLDLPVVVVPEWTNEAITERKLLSWFEERKHFFDEVEPRKQVLFKLTREYWWQKMMEPLRKILISQGVSL